MKQSELFVDRALRRIRELGTPLCIGMDPAIALMQTEFLATYGLEPTATDPARCAEALYGYCAEILEAVGDMVALVKPQTAYFELYGSYGMQALERTIAESHARGLLVVLDAKRGDIGPTSEA